MLNRIQKTLAEIRATLLNDETVRKLLFNTQKACLSAPAPTKEAASKYITLHPIYQFQNKEDYEQNGMINITLPNIEVDNDSNYIGGVVQINVAFNVDIWDIEDNKIRPLELSNRIIELIDKKKFSISNPIEFSIINDLVVSKQVVGYALLFDFEDGSSKIENF